MKFTCPCCGYLTFDEPTGSYDICEICFWEDDISQLMFPKELGANDVSLLQGQKNFKKFGACEKRLKQNVRKPSPQDKRDPLWRPLNLRIDSIENHDYLKSLQNGKKVLCYWLKH